MTTLTQQLARQWFHDNALACIAEVESGAVKLASHYPVELYREKKLEDAQAALRGDYDHTFTFRQRAQWIETGVCVPLFPTTQPGEKA